MDLNNYPDNKTYRVLVMCATCKHRGHLFEHRDNNMVMHCSKLSRELEAICIARNHHKWEQDEKR